MDADGDYALRKGKSPVTLEGIHAAAKLLEGRVLLRAYIDGVYMLPMHVFACTLHMHVDTHTHTRCYLRGARCLCIVQHLHRIALHRIALNCIASCHVISCHIISCHIMS